ncbi:modular serine protease-like [Chrysoperla carnea]|uniref:modular serine protease-like n=1 Tax=Chrysoperla carnea TaxID=189513 RepID=UPI001D0835A2|nr:modular serine protease-like [Chrysoperla carnea]
MCNNFSAVCVLTCIYFINLFVGIQCQRNPCPSDEFYCGNSDDQCIPNALKCDGKPDCNHNHADESYKTCKSNICKPNEFHCAYGACVPLSSRCNKIRNCLDGSDEFYCDKCEPTELCSEPWLTSCASGDCIYRHQICDGVQDCPDNSDETFSLCTKIRSDANTFRCKYGACIDSNLRCNGRSNCVDHSDEFECDKNIISDNFKPICGKHSFQCNSYLCIKEEQVCDGIIDCDDGSDETFAQCNNKKCTNTTICPYGACKTGSDCIPAPRPTRATVPKISPKSMMSTALVPDNCEPAPEVDDEVGSVTICPDVSPGILQSLPSGTILYYTCKDGYLLTTSTPTIVCMNGNWSNEFPECKRSCPPLESATHEIKCTYMDKEVSCNKPFAGVIASVKCKHPFIIRNPRQLQYYNGIECLENGKWDNELHACYTDCGKISLPVQTAPSEDDITPKIAGGYDVNRIEDIPWHAAIYEKINGTYDQMCGGSIITETIIVTAAHCFFNYSVSPYVLKDNKNDRFAVAVGKKYRSWDSELDTKAQRFTIKFKVHPDFLDNDFRFDIAVVKLNKPISFNLKVRPICVDWSNKKNPIRFDKPGIVAGWGITDREDVMSHSEKLQAVNLPYVDKATCIKYFQDSLPEFTVFITPDSFCGGNRNGSITCPGDSGGGFAFKEGNRYYLRGITSTGPSRNLFACDIYEYAVFTDIQSHLNFIKENIKKPVNIKPNRNKFNNGPSRQPFNSKSNSLLIGNAV